MKLTLPAANRAKVISKLPAPVVTKLLQDERKARHLAAAQQVELWLREHYPDAFHGPPGRPPLAIGIRQQILEAAVAADSLINPKALGSFLGWWVRRSDYLDGLARGVARVNLDGSTAGVPSEDAQWRAAQQVYGPRADQVMARIAARRLAEQTEQTEQKELTE